MEEADIVVKTMPKLRCQNRYKPFAESHCLLGISVGQEAHESLKFQATIDLVSKNFGACTICVGDTLQRFTLAIKMNRSPESLYEYSRKLGEDWINRNFPIYSRMKIPFHVVRWDEYLTSPDFKFFSKKIRDLYDSNHECKAAFYETVNSFLMRYSKREPMEDSIVVRMKYYCIEYLLEECAVMCLWANEGYEYEAYPSRRNQAMEWTYRNLISPHKQNVITSVVIDAVNFMY